MNGIGTGNYEYIIMLLVYVVLALITIGSSLKKWIEEKRVSCTSYEFTIGNILVFIALRLGVVSFLLYLQLAFLPGLTKSRQSNTLSNQEYERIAQTYLVTWELLSFLGTCALYSTLTSLVYKWRQFLNGGDLRSNMALVIGLNSILFFIGLFCVVMQYFFDFANYTWVHIVYYYCCINMMILGAIFIYHADKLSQKSKPTNELTFQLFRHGVYNKYSAIVCGFAFIIRGVVMALDSVGYRYLNNGTSAQIVWNIFFKYLCWIIPEMLVVMCVLICLVETDSFHNVLAVIYGRVHGNTAYAEVPTVEIGDIEDVLKNNPPNLSDTELNEMKEKTGNNNLRGGSIGGSSSSGNAVASGGYAKFEDE